jgi:hypothetical protein
MKLDPFVAAHGVAFDASRDELVRVRGFPWRQQRNEVGLNELDYGDAVFRFQDNGRLEEITARAPVLNLGAVSVPFASLEAFIRAQDAEAFERARFLVSPRFGLAFDPREPDWVTALAHHAIAQWQAL